MYISISRHASHLTPPTTHTTLTSPLANAGLAAPHHGLREVERGHVERGERVVRREAARAAAEQTPAESAGLRGARGPPALGAAGQNEASIGLGCPRGGRRRRRRNPGARRPLRRPEAGAPPRPRSERPSVRIRARRLLRAPGRRRWAAGRRTASREGCGAPKPKPRAWPWCSERAPASRRPRGEGAGSGRVGSGRSRSVAGPKAGLG